jgi:hypothetical protein
VDQHDGVGALCAIAPERLGGVPAGGGPAGPAVGADQQPVLSAARGSGRAIRLVREGARNPLDVSVIGPRVKPEKLQLARKTKPPVYIAWSEALNRGGGHAEVHWRTAFEAEGWAVPDKPVQVLCPDPSHALHTKRHEIDVYAILGGRMQSLAK